MTTPGRRRAPPARQRSANGRSSSGSATASPLPPAPLHDRHRRRCRGGGRRRGALQVLTTDALVEGVHFDLRFSSFADVGYKALAVNVSDIAAMGATPRLALLSLILPDRLIGRGRRRAARRRSPRWPARPGVTLAGGNITRSPGPLVVDVTADRRRPPAADPDPRRRPAGRRPVRHAASIGAAAAGLGWLRRTAGRRRLPDDRGAGGAASPAIAGPAPRLRVGALLGRTRAATACMDLSDGLADAVTPDRRGQRHRGRRSTPRPAHSDAGARRWFASPGHGPGARRRSPAATTTSCCSRSPPQASRPPAAVVRQARGVPLTRIGELTAAPAILLKRDGRDRAAARRVHPLLSAGVDAW